MPWLCAILVLALLACGGAHAAQLTMGPARMGANGWETPVLLSLNPGELVASMQFDVALPPGQSATAQAGPAALEAGKQAIANLAGNGQLRVVVAGLNQSTLQNGEVAIVHHGQPDNAAPDVALYAPVLATPQGERVPLDSPVDPEPVDDVDPRPDTPEPPTQPEGEEPEPEPVPDKSTPDPASPEDTDDDVNSGGYYGGYPGGLGGVTNNDMRDSDKSDAKQGGGTGAARQNRSALPASPAANAQPGVHVGQIYDAGASDGSRRSSGQVPASTGAPPRIVRAIEGQRTGEAPQLDTASETNPTAPWQEARSGAVGGGGGRGGVRPGVAYPGSGVRVGTGMARGAPFPWQVRAITLAVAGFALTLLVGSAMYKKYGKSGRKLPRKKRA